MTKQFFILSTMIASLLGLASVAAETEPVASKYLFEVPTIKYKGKLCSNVVIARLAGSSSLDVNCYFQHAKMTRQCTFGWGEQDRTGRLSVLEFEKKGDSKKETRTQSFSMIASENNVALKDIAAVATRMLDQHCTAKQKKSDVIKHVEETMNSEDARFKCSFKTRNIPGDKITYRNINCSDNAREQTQCVASEEFCGESSYSTIVSSQAKQYFDRDQWRVFTGLPPTCPQDVSKKFPSRLSDRKFKSNAIAWFKQHCYSN